MRCYGRTWRPRGSGGTPGPGPRPARREHGAKALSCPTVQDYVRVAGCRSTCPRAVCWGCSPSRSTPTGADTEVNFAELVALLGGVKMKCNMFLMQLSNNGRAVHRIYPTQAREASLKGRIEAFGEFSGGRG